MALNDIQIRKLRPSEKPFKKSDGEGLFIEVKPSGSKLWRMAYRFDNKQKLLSFGSYPTVSLAMARQKRHEARLLLTQGVDPSAAKKEARAEHKAQTENTFGNIARELIDKKGREGKAESTLKKQLWFLSLAEPDLGKLPVAEIKPPEVLAVLRKVVRSWGNGMGCKQKVTTSRNQNDNQSDRQIAKQSGNGAVAPSQ